MGLPLPHRRLHRLLHRHPPRDHRRQAVPPDNPLLPNYKWVPIGYHGRASSIGVSGQRFRAPAGPDQGAGRGRRPAFGPSQRLDYELELGFFVGPRNAPGEPLAHGRRAEAHVFGVALFNDWTARDIQAWEYQPLGPVPVEELRQHASRRGSSRWRRWRRSARRSRAPPATRSRCPTSTRRGRTASAARFDIELEVWLQTAKMRAAGSRRRVCAPAPATPTGRRRSWSRTTPCNGCNLQPGDLLGSRHAVGPGRRQAGSLLELTQGGKQPIRCPTASTRTFLRGRRQRDPARPLRARRRAAHRLRRLRRHGAGGRRAAGLRQASAGRARRPFLPGLRPAPACCAFSWPPRASGRSRCPPHRTRLRRAACRACPSGRSRCRRSASRRRSACSTARRAG